VVPEGAPSDIHFYPPLSNEADALLRRAEFSVSKDLSACLAITFAFYSPQANKGKLIFNNFKVFRKTEGAFHFPRNGDPTYIAKYGEQTYSGSAAVLNEQKKKVKAFELRMDIEYIGERTSTYSGDGNGMLILTPNNGVEL
jgi:hypothetical protein